MNGRQAEGETHLPPAGLEEWKRAVIVYFVDRNTAPPTVCAHFKLMAEFENRFEDNTNGRFYVDDQCIDCDLCRETAPDNFTRNDDGGYSFVYKQPESEEEDRLAREAMEGCPVEAIGDDGPAATVGEGAGEGSQEAG